MIWAFKLAFLYDIVHLLSIFFDNRLFFFTLLETKGRHKHRGALLEAAVKARAANVTQLAKLLRISRATYYNHRNDANLSLETLMEYGKFLKYDFSQDLPELKQLMLDDEEIGYANPKTLEEAVAQRDHWKEKYFRLLERYVKDREKGEE